MGGFTASHLSQWPIPPIPVFHREDISAWHRAIFRIGLFDWHASQPLTWECRHWANTLQRMHNKALVVYQSTLKPTTTALGCTLRLHSGVHSSEYSKISAHLPLGFFFFFLPSLLFYSKSQLDQSRTTSPQRNASDQLTYYTQCNYFSEYFQEYLPRRHALARCWPSRMSCHHNSKEHNVHEELEAFSRTPQLAEAHKSGGGLPQCERILLLRADFPTASRAFERGEGSSLPSLQYDTV